MNLIMELYLHGLANVSGQWKQFLTRVKINWCPIWQFCACMH